MTRFVHYFRKPLTLEALNLRIAKMYVIPENPLFPNPVLPKTSVHRGRDIEDVVLLFIPLLSQSQSESSPTPRSMFLFSSFADCSISFFAPLASKKANQLSFFPGLV